jgi:hypothetical protein
MLLLLLAAYDGQSHEEVDPALDLCWQIKDASSPVQSSLLQKQQALSSSAGLRHPASLTQLGRSRASESPLQIFFGAHPSWLVCIISLSILTALGTMVWLISWLLDQYEARRWASGQIGKPWYMDENMVMYVGGGALAMWIGVSMLLFTTVVHFYTPIGETRSLTNAEAIYVAYRSSPRSATEISRHLTLPVRLLSLLSYS